MGSYIITISAGGSSEPWVTLRKAPIFSSRSLVGAVDFAFDPELAAHLRRPLAEDGGREAIAGLVDQGAGKILRLADDHAFAQACFRGGLVG